MAKQQHVEQPGARPATKRERSKARRAERQERERQATRQATVRRRVAVGLGFAVVLALLAGLSLLLSGGGEELPDESVAPEVSGQALPPFPATGGADPAVGVDAPGVTGSDYRGAEVAIGEGGQAQAIVFLAHWCPHCQREVPAVVDWVEQGNLPDDVELVAVSTLADANQPNFPPQDWLAREGWSTPVLADPDDTVAEAYGLQGTPFWVFLDDQGRVVSRAGGMLGVDQLAERAAAISRG